MTDEISPDEAARMYNSAAFLGEPGCTELRRVLGALDEMNTKRDEACGRLDAVRALEPRWRRAAELRDPALDHEATSLVFNACADELRAMAGAADLDTALETAPPKDGAYVVQSCPGCGEVCMTCESTEIGKSGG